MTSTDLTDKVFTYLTVICVTDQRINTKVIWLCKCVCGNDVYVSTGALNTGNTKSCGCYNDEIRAKMGTERFTTHGDSRTAEYKMHAKAKDRAKSNNIPFDFKYDDIKIPEKCPILGITMCANTGGSGFKDNSPSLDKRIPELGYVTDNVYVISMLANRLKSNNTNSLFFRAISDYVDNSFQGFGDKPLVAKYLPKKKRLPYPYFNPII